MVLLHHLPTVSISVLPQKTHQNRKNVLQCTRWELMDVVELKNTSQLQVMKRLELEHHWLIAWNQTFWRKRDCCRKFPVKSAFHFSWIKRKVLPFCERWWVFHVWLGDLVEEMQNVVKTHWCESARVRFLYLSQRGLRMVNLMEVSFVGLVRTLCKWPLAKEGMLEKVWGIQPQYLKALFWVGMWSPFGLGDHHKETFCTRDKPQMRGWN